MIRRLSTPLLILALLAWAPQAVFAQEGELPVIRANSTSVDVQDGHNFRKGHWFIDPTLELDVYYAQRSTKPKKVTFITDVESITFDVEPGGTYNFVILLNGTTRCRTRISGMRRSARPSGASELTAPAEIPFTLDDDNTIRLEVRVNDSQPLMFQFDTGADNTVVYDSALARGANPTFDGTILNAGLGGTVTRRTSSDNRLRVAGLVWDHEQVMHIEKQGRGVDGILGYNVFEDRVIEIDYDRKVLTVHPSPPPGLAEYTKGEMQFRGTVPHIQATFESGPANTQDWLLLDTGFTGTLLLNRDFWNETRLGDGAEYLGRSKSHGVGPGVVHGEIVRLPALTLGGATLRDIPSNVEVEPTGARQSAGLIGMDVLKRFNTVLDFQNNAIYLKPNTLLAVPFDQPGPNWRNIILLSASSILIVAALLYWHRRTRRWGRKSDIRRAPDVSSGSAPAT